MLYIALQSIICDVYFRRFGGLTHQNNTSRVPVSFIDIVRVVRAH